VPRQTDKLWYNYIPGGHSNWVTVSVLFCVSSVGVFLLPEDEWDRTTLIQADDVVSFGNPRMGCSSYEKLFSTDNKEESATKHLVEVSKGWKCCGAGGEEQIAG
jgi:hypothetical protein